MRVYRITKPKYAEDLTGEGAYLFGGRWNSAGRRCLYTAESVALAAWETYVHLKKNIPKNFVLVTLKIPEDIILLEKEYGDKPTHWKRKSPIHPWTIQTGDDFLMHQKALAMQVPSVVVQGNNYLINPLHPAMADVNLISVTDFNFDKRIPLP